MIDKIKQLTEKLYKLQKRIDKINLPKTPLFVTKLSDMTH